MKKIILILALLFTTLQVNALEDCIVAADGQLYDIRIENHDIIDVYPLITIKNDKNILIVHPLKTGITAFTVLKNGKDRHYFSVKVDENQTIIKGDECFSILSLDEPPADDGFELDLPPSEIQMEIK